MFGIERNCLGKIEVYAPLLDRSSITTGMIEEGLNEAKTLLELLHVNRTPEETELNRESLYKSLSKDGNPSFAAITRIMKALGLRMTLAEQKI